MNMNKYLTYLKEIQNSHTTVGNEHLNTRVLIVDGL